MEEIFELIRTEREHQISKWGMQHHDQAAWSLIELEELGEVAKEANEIYFERNNSPIAYDQLIHEVVQVAAVAVAWLQDLIENWAPPRQLPLNLNPHVVNRSARYESMNKPIPKWNELETSIISKRILEANMSLDNEIPSAHTKEAAEHSTKMRKLYQPRVCGDCQNWQEEQDNGDSEHYGRCQSNTGPRKGCILWSNVTACLVWK